MVKTHCHSLALHSGEIPREGHWDYWCLRSTKHGRHPYESLNPGRPLTTYHWTWPTFGLKGSVGLWTHDQQAEHRHHREIWHTTGEIPTGVEYHRTCTCIKDTHLRDNRIRLLTYIRYIRSQNRVSKADWWWVNHSQGMLPVSLCRGCAILERSLMNFW